MNPDLDVSPRVADLLGPDGLAQVSDIDLTSRLWCPVCEQYKPAGVSTAMAVLALEADGVLVVGYAHRECRDRVGDDWPGLRATLDDPAGLDASAFFGIRATRTLRAVMAFEPAATSTTLTGTGDAVNSYVAWHLEAGFTSARAGTEDLTARVVPRWRLTTRAGALVLEHEELGMAYEQPLNEHVRVWLRTVKREGRALVLTGVDLGINPDADDFPDFAVARAKGTLVAGTVLFG